MAALGALAWLNLLGLLVVAGLYWLGDLMRGTPAYRRALQRVALLVAATFIVAEAHGWLPAAPHPVVKLCAALLIAFTAWELVGGTIALLLDDPDTSIETVGARAPSVDDLSPSAEQEAAAALPEGVIDLDAGTLHSVEHRARRERAIRRLVAEKISLDERIQALAVLTNPAGDEGEDGEDPGESDWAYLLVGQALLAGALIPPCWIAWQTF